MWSRLPTRDRLQRFEICCNPECLLCYQEAESQHHLFFQCSYRLTARTVFRKSSSGWVFLHVATMCKTSQTGYLETASIVPLGSLSTPQLLLPVPTIYGEQGMKFYGTTVIFLARLNCKFIIRYRNSLELKRGKHFFIV